MKFSKELKIKLLPWIAAIALFMQMLDGSILGMAIPSMAASFNEDPINMQIILISYMLSVAIFLPISGWLADRFGIKKVFLIAIMVFTVGSFLCAVSNSLFFLTISRMIQGMGGALLVPVSRLAVLKVYPRSQYLNVLSFIVIPALIGTLIGPTLGGIIVEYSSWNWIFLINIPVGILCFIMTFFVMPIIAHSERIKFDLTGFIIFDFAVLLLFMTGITKSSIFDVSKIYFLVAAMIFIFIYCLYAKTKKNALFDITMFKVPSFTIGIAGNVIVRMVGGAMSFLSPLFLQTVLNFSPSKAGFALLPMGITAMLIRMFASSIILRTGYKGILIFSTTMLSVFIPLVAFIGSSAPYCLILALYAFIGMANSLQFTAINTLALIAVPDRMMSGANSLLSVSFQISMALGVALTAMLLSTFELFTGTSNLTLTFQITHIIIGVLSMSGVLIFLFIPKSAEVKIV